MKARITTNNKCLTLSARLPFPLLNRPLQESRDGPAQDRRGLSKKSARAEASSVLKREIANGSALRRFSTRVRNAVLCAPTHGTSREAMASRVVGGGAALNSCQELTRAAPLRQPIRTGARTLGPRAFVRWRTALSYGPPPNRCEPRGDAREPSRVLYSFRVVTTQADSVAAPCSATTRSR